METTSLKSASVQTLFDCIIQICHEPSDKSFSNSMLSEIHFDDVLDQIRRLPEGVDLKRDISMRTEKIEPGTVYVLDVDVGWKGTDVVVSERETNSSKRNHFFDMNKATKVLWIHSESIRMIDAKLKVFQKYERELGRENILFYHDFEKDKDDILILSARQKLDSLYEKTKCQKEKVPDQTLQQILQEAASRALTQQKIREMCESVDLHYKGDHVGKCGHGNYTCYSKSTVDEIKRDLVEKTLNETAKLFGTAICQGILQHIKPNVQGTVDRQFSKLNDSISKELFPLIVIVVLPFLQRIFFLFLGMIYTAWSYVVIFFSSVDVNSHNWRLKVADEIYSVISEKERELIDEILPHVKEICDTTRKEIETVCKRIMACKQEIILSNHKKEIKEWKKREVIRNLMTFPSVQGYTSGTKNGKDVVKIFIYQDNENSDKKSDKESSKKSDKKLEKESEEKVKSDIKKLFKERFEEKTENRTYFKGEPNLEFVNVKTIIENRSKFPKTERKAPSISGYVRSKIDKIIQNEGERLIATYSNVTGLGIDRMLLDNDRFGDPCIVFYCFDKALVPFGEEELPTHLKGYPVDIREEFIMFAYCCSDCHPLAPGLSIGIPRNQKTGSIGFFVRSTVSSSDHGILTAAHVALNEEDMTLSNDGLLRGTHQIIHPSCQDSATTTIIGPVSRSVCKNIGPDETGVDAAYVKFNMPASGDKIELEIATDHDLPFDDENDILVRKTGRTSGHTIGILKSASHYPSIISRTYFGRTFNFRSCYYIEDHGGELFFKLGDSGSGVFLINGEKPLGIGFAIGLRGTYVCKISEILREFKVTIYRENAQE